MLKASENRGTDAIKFDPKNGTFRDSDGEALDRDGINALGVSGFGKKALAGGSTLARQAFLRSILRAISEAKRGTDGRPDGILEAVRDLADKYQVATRRLFYSRNADKPTMSADSLAAFAESVKNSNLSSQNSEPQRAVDSTRSQNQRPVILSSMTMLSAAEIESLRQETRQAMAMMRDQLKNQSHAHDNSTEQVPKFKAMQEPLDSQALPKQ